MQFLSDVFAAIASSDHSVPRNSILMRQISGDIIILVVMGSKRKFVRVGVSPGLLSLSFESSSANKRQQNSNASSIQVM